jgi:hypothetical protein
VQHQRVPDDDVYGQGCIGWAQLAGSWVLEYQVVAGLPLLVLVITLRHGFPRAGNHVRCICPQLMKWQS